MKIRNRIPAIGKKLASYTGAELIDRIGENTVKDVVANVLCGLNIRSLTENLTRKRLALSNAALLITYMHSSADHKEEFAQKLTAIVSNELLETGLDKDEKQYLQWLIGLTGKSIQNVLRGDKQEFLEYVRDLEQAIKESVEEAEKIFGKLAGNITVKQNTLNLTWGIITQIFTAIGAQTLALRGSEKSLYGKLFEKFILGSLLTILGFTLSKSPSKSDGKMIFWLSERGDKRESDATALISLGKGVRFDIGFIGPGNTEISLDKVSRFETEMKLGRQSYYMSTIIIVDRIGEGSRIKEMAKEIHGEIVQMSMCFWVKEIANILKIKTGFTHEILQLNDRDSIQYIRNKMKTIDLRTFI